MGPKLYRLESSFTTHFHRIRKSLAFIYQFEYDQLTSDQAPGKEFQDEPEDGKLILAEIHL